MSVMCLDHSLHLMCLKVFLDFRCIQSFAFRIFCLYKTQKGRIPLNHYNSRILVNSKNPFIYHITVTIEEAGINAKI